ncbi:DUF945 family protein [Candidatus Berkiella aquae]|uniref:YdgA family protein n=1 Tax=Candidatus Berkiella aquae TaxID=295108 RepID=A0A0Q9YIP2_9GAMM|nr:YdgA family protein [Candidatus Berkiella aquae]MCS5712247.1 YdgA family protein [Candidatus Berkiella aquae]
MKRKIGIYILLIAIILGAAPYLAGFIVENKFKDIVQATSELDSMTISVVEYDRGWRKSHAKTRVTFQGDVVEKLNLQAQQHKVSGDIASKDISIMIVHDIRHGPFVQLKDGNYADWTFALATIHSVLAPTEEAKKQLMAVVGETELVTMDSEIKIDGATKAKIVGKELKIQEADQEHFLWKGVTGDWELSRDLKRFQGNLLMPGFDAYLTDSRFIGEDLVIKTDRFKTPEGLWLGNLKLDLQKFQGDKAKKTKFVITGLAASGVNDLENNMIESSGTIRIEHIDFDDQKYGPVNYSGSVKNISPVVMKRFIEISKDLQKAPEAEQVKYAQQLFELVPDFLKARPVLVIDDFSIGTPEGQFKSALSVEVGGPEAYDMQNTQKIVQSIVAKGNIFLPRALLHRLLAVARNQETTEQVNTQADELINKQIQEGLWVTKNELLTMDFEFKDSQLKVNGKSLDLFKILFEAKTQATQAHEHAAPAPQAPQGGSDTGTSSMSAPH